MALLPDHEKLHPDKGNLDGKLRRLGSETMIVRINHKWYDWKRYDMSDQYDTIEFLHDLRAVTQFATRCEIRLVKGDAGDP